MSMSQKIMQGNDREQTKGCFFNPPYSLSLPLASRGRGLAVEIRVPNQVLRRPLRMLRLPSVGVFQSSSHVVPDGENQRTKGPETQTIKF